MGEGVVVAVQLGSFGRINPISFTAEILRGMCRKRGAQTFICAYTMGSLIQPHMRVDEFCIILSCRYYILYLAPLL